MLYLGKKKWCKSLESLFESKEFRNVEDIHKIRKLLNKGENVYVMYNPLVGGLKDSSNDPDVCIWGTDQKELEEEYYSLAEEV